MNESSSGNKELCIMFSFLAVMIVSIFAIGFLSALFPDEFSSSYVQRAIRAELTRRGYCTCNLDIEFVRRGEHHGTWIYQSSVPIYCNDGYINHWIFTRRFYGLFAPLITWTSLTPYILLERDMG